MEQEHLNEFKEFLKNTKGLSIKTIADYSYWIRDLNPAMLSQEYINAYVQKKGNSSGIRGAIDRFLEMTGLSKTFDMPPKATGRTKKRIVREISDEEIKIMSKHLYSKSFKKGLIFDMMYQGALRRDEATSIKLSSFKWLEWIDDITKFCQLIVIGKGNKERVVLINPETAEKIFNHYLAKYSFENIEQIRTFANSPSLLFTNDGKKISTWFVWNVIHSGSKEALGRDIRPHELRHCLKKDCKILTLDGWKKWNELHIGMPIFSYNINKDCIEKDVIKNIFIYDFDGQLNYFKNSWLDYGFTDEHKHILKILKGKQIKNTNRDYWKNYQKLTIQELKEKINKRSIKHKISSKYNGDISIGKEKAGILGWILTDATITKRNNPSISICQSYKSNLKKCEYIEKLLIDSNILFTKTKNNKGIMNFQLLKGGNRGNIRGINHDWIFEFIEKDRTPKWKLLNLKYEELKELYKCMMLGDGTGDKEFCNQNIKRIEFFRILCCLLGKNTSLGKKQQNGKEYYRIYVQNKNECQIQIKNHLLKDYYKGKVFCIETKNGSFIAQSNEKFFITGNCRATELEKMGVPIRDIKNYLGHSSLATTEIYLHRSEKESIETIEQFLEKK